MLWQSYLAQHATASARTSKPHTGSQTMAPQRRQRPQSATCPHVKVQTGTPSRHMALPPAHNAQATRTTLTRYPALAMVGTDHFPGNVLSRLRYFNPRRGKEVNE
jgi:hypothetical protein